MPVAGDCAEFMPRVCATPAARARAIDTPTAARIRCPSFRRVARQDRAAATHPPLAARRSGLGSGNPRQQRAAWGLENARIPARRRDLVPEPGAGRQALSTLLFVCLPAGILAFALGVQHDGSVGDIGPGSALAIATSVPVSQ